MADNSTTVEAAQAAETAAATGSTGAGTVPQPATAETSAGTGSATTAAKTTDTTTVAAAQAAETADADPGLEERVAALETEVSALKAGGTSKSSDATAERNTFVTRMERVERAIFGPENQR